MSGARPADAARGRSTTLPLRGRVTLVTGAGRGIGRALASAFATHGARVVLAARTKRDLESLRRQLERRGAVTLAVPCDVRQAAQVRSLVDAIQKRFRRLDIVVNNAGAFQIRPFEETDEELWDTIVDTNLKSVFLVTRAALPLLKRQRGHIVNIASVAGRVAFAGSAAYCASKWGVMGLTAVLREELRPAGVRVTAVLPGRVDTPIWDSIAGTWDRSRMVPAATIAEAIAGLCTLPSGACPEELVITPTGTAR